MIQYALKCAEGHSFDSWFQSAAAFDKLVGAGMVSCSVCGGADVEKAIMAPRVTGARDDTATASVPGPLSQPASPAEQALAALRDKVERDFDYVGDRFATEARAMHDGDSAHRAIYGEARTDEARKLIEDGVPVAPLPFLSKRQAN